MKRKAIVISVCLTLVGLCSSAFGESSYLTAWKTKYPTSTAATNISATTSSQCVLCHFNGTKSTFNAYGWAVRAQLGGATGVNSATITAAFVAVEALNSDGDPTGWSNWQEIVTYNTQPGWRTGANNTNYNKSGATTTGQNPITLVAGTLDPVTTSVELLYFKAKSQKNNIALKWKTASEINNEGFNIWRSGEKSGEYTKINDALIPANGSNSGATYKYKDKTVKKRKTYFYKLETIDNNSNSELFDPVKAKSK
ncbi:MAG: hypothetical protein HZA77_13860 [Candidatus Schekmanbacteria bacterium]|nr:hypothetical protein [Candidatus Schekmanbacteria bacterium]